MRNILLVLASLVGATVVWLLVWYFMMAPHVARVEASIAYHYQHLREKVTTMSLKVDKVYATGFPFHFRVAVERPTLSMVDGNETYAVSMTKLELEPIDSNVGSYRVLLPQVVEALYAKNGAAPEHYTVTASEMPKLNLSAHDASKPCGFGTDRACQPAQAGAPIISFALGLPSSITLHMTLGNESRDAQFSLPSINVPIYQPIPDTLDRPLVLFVGVLREALVFHTLGNEVTPR